MTTRSRTPQDGYALLEVLIAMLVLSIGLLSMAKLQMEGLRYNNTAFHRTYATMLAYDIVDRMRANSKVAETGAYTVGFGGGGSGSSACEGTGANCDQTAMAAYDLAQWKKNLNDVLPSGDGAISYDGTLYTITVQWLESRQSTTPTQFQTVTNL